MYLNQRQYYSKFSLTSTYLTVGVNFSHSQTIPHIVLWVDQNCATQLAFMCELFFIVLETTLRALHMLYPPKVSHSHNHLLALHKLEASAMTLHHPVSISQLQTTQ